MTAKLLLADDSVTIQKVVELTLADEDYDITMVSDGASALQKAAEIHADLILADIVMPELNGYELCERIRQNPALADTPVLLLSSTFETYDEERGRSVGANDNIVKPFESDVLIQKIRTCLEKKSRGAAAAPQRAGLEGFAPAETRAAHSAPTPTPERVEEEAFDFELTDAFMEEAEEMFDTAEEIPPLSVPSVEESEEILAEDHETEVPADDEMFVSPPSEDVFAEQTDRFSETEEAEEFAPGFVEEFPDLEPSGELAASDRKDEAREVPTPGSPHEIDRELMEDDHVNVYEIPEEFAETPDLELSTVGAESSETPFVVEDTAQVSPTELIDDFMSAEEPERAPSPARNQEEELTDEEIFSAVEPGTPSFEEHVPEEEEAVAGVPQETEEPFEQVFSMENSVDSEWSPELATYGGNPERVSEDVVEKPFPEKILGGPASGPTEETIRKIVSELVDEKAAEIIERVAWEVIPDLAEALIRKEIQRLQQEVERS